MPKPGSKLGGSPSPGPDPRPSSGEGPAQAQAQAPVQAQAQAQAQARKKPHHTPRRRRPAGWGGAAELRPAPSLRGAAAAGPGSAMASGGAAARAAEEPPPPEPPAEQKPPPPPLPPVQEEFSFLPLVHDIIKCMDKDSQDVHQVLNELKNKFQEMRKLISSMPGIGVSPEQQQQQLQNLREQVRTKNELLQKYKSLCMFEIPKE
ncbi:mediator of RNA polymerase II transcription subunit 9 [Alca torda]